MRGIAPQHIAWVSFTAEASPLNPPLETGLSRDHLACLAQGRLRPRAALWGIWCCAVVDNTSDWYENVGRLLLLLLASSEFQQIRRKLSASNPTAPDRRRYDILAAYVKKEIR
jgi:hypothetical protein